MAKQQIGQQERGEWVVRCRVSGGVTGTRESVCKRNDAVLYFDTEADALAYAADMKRTYNNPYAVAFFEYWPARASEVRS